MTYNIHKGIGGIDRRYRLERIVDVIRQEDPDIVLLQEVDEGVPRSSHDDQSRLLAEALGYPHMAHQRNVRVKFGHYGNAILSKLPLTNARDFDLTIRFKKRRQALIAQCELPQITGGLVLTSSHLGLLGVERRIQARRLVEELRTHANCIVGGDMNDNGRLLERVFTDAAFHASPSRARTFPAVRPIRAWDRIFVRGCLRIASCHVPTTKQAARASDHRPLVLDLQVARHH